MLDDVLLERGALQEFHRNEGVAIFVANVIDGADIRMIEGGGGLCFALQASERARVVADIFGQEFQRDIAVEAIVFGFVDNAHTAAAETFENAVVRESLAEELVGGGHAGDMLDGGAGGGQSRRSIET